MSPLFKYGLIFIICVVLFALLDALWIGLIAKKWYLSSIGHLLKKSHGVFAPNMLAGALTWLIIVGGLFIFVVPKTAYSQWAHNFLWGALYGFILYGTYDLTNLAVVHAWPISITVIDILWGSFACGMISVASTLLHRVLL